MKTKARRYTYRLLGPFALLLALGVILQLGALWSLRQINERQEYSRQRMAVAANLLVLLEQFESTAYLAVVGLSISDWELLLRQRTESQELNKHFETSYEALLDGGMTRLGAMDVALERAEESAIVEALQRAKSSWDEMLAAHVRVLRSDNSSLKDNPDLERLRATSTQVSLALQELMGLLQSYTDAELVWLGHAQRLIPPITVALALLMGAFVLQSIIRPLGLSMEKLYESEGALRVARDELEQRVEERTAELAQANVGLRQAEEDLLAANANLENRVRERTRELRAAQHRAIDLARQAGMSEVATNILHNVGNVLNSVTTSAALLGDQLRTARLERVTMVAEMFQEHRLDLATFLSDDERGRSLPDYLLKLGQHLVTQRDEMHGLTGTLQRHIEHIRTIVSVQQNYAKSPSIIEATCLDDLIADALRINAAALGRHEVSIKQELAELPRVMLDKHQVLQILLNLISNAKYAVSENASNDRQIVLRLERTDNNVIRIQVSDNGIGIKPEHLTGIFQHGFTTRKDGHGFGLHSSAIAARAMGGSLSAQSDGPGCGATFTFELPLQPEHVA